MPKDKGYQLHFRHEEDQRRPAKSIAKEVQRDQLTVIDVGVTFQPQIMEVR
jgi:hypothetical protein